MKRWLKKLLVFFGTVALAVVGGVVAVLLTHFAASHFAFVAALESQVGSLVVEAITGALGSGTTVYLVMTVIQIPVLKEGVREEIAAGFLGKMEIPRLAKAVKENMVPLPYLSGHRSRHFALEHMEDFRKKVAKCEPGQCSEVALSVTTGVRYSASDFRDAHFLLAQKFQAKYKHHLVLSADQRNIVAASEYGQTDIIKSSMTIDLNLIDLFLDWVNDQRIEDLQLLGFATQTFRVDNTARMLLRQFVESQASEALLYFSDKRKNTSVVGMIQLWQLVKLALGKPFLDSPMPDDPEAEQIEPQQLQTEQETSVATSPI